MGVCNSAWNKNKFTDIKSSVIKNKTTTKKSATKKEA